MKDVLVGYSGFVGSNIEAKHNFDGLYDSRNVEEAYGTNPELLVYSGVPAQKFIANKFPEEDFRIIEGAIENIKKINPKKIVLISTIDIYKNPIDVDEDSNIDVNDLQPYGKNRYYLEEWVKNNFEDYLIVHLPGLYGKNIKKNFIYDLINVIPSMLKEEKFNELVEKDNLIKEYYELQDNGFYKCKDTSKEEKDKLKTYFNNVGFTALNFTDSRGVYQFYNLQYLWGHICKALENNIKVLNLAVEPISTGELYKYLYGREFVNEITENIPYYNYKTKHYKLFGGNDGYIFNKEFILEDIKNYIKKMR